ncbi:hypothetical protein K8O68_17850 [Salipaludibacillus sp. CUR1]|uniref:hypothetical protein n=1 Tax=Salipaludibacillus sp. CUR1 TaxID=2820003 RepID=UPI001E4375BB|nr:hypothetical protein [Salipaludibacillus sp. CUR1]MCE7794249.1 hypothetical protein [Salipaludibacillus sp. CUR1]
MNDDRHNYNDDRSFQGAEENPFAREDDNEFREETSAEFTPNPGLAGGRGPIEVTSDRTREIESEPHTERETGEEEETQTQGRGVGSLGIAFSLVSLFFLPLIFSVTGIILGAVAVRREQRGLGYTAIAIGAFTLVMSVFFAPFVS